MGEEFRELKSVDGKVVGLVCKECGRLSTTAHWPNCSHFKGSEAASSAGRAAQPGLSEGQVREVIEFLTELSHTPEYRSHALGCEDSISRGWKEDAADLLVKLAASQASPATPPEVHAHAIRCNCPSCIPAELRAPVQSTNPLDPDPPGEEWLRNPDGTPKRWPSGEIVSRPTQRVQEDEPMLCPTCGRVECCGLNCGQATFTEAEKKEFGG